MKNVKQYVNPEIEIYKFSTEDLIVTSAGSGHGADDGELDE